MNGRITNSPTRCLFRPHLTPPNAHPSVSCPCALPFCTEQLRATIVYLTLHVLFYRSIPGPSKLSIPATASFQVTLSNLASFGIPQCDSAPRLPCFEFSDSCHSYIAFNRASDPSQPSGVPFALWELDGWWQPPDVQSPGATSIGTTIAVIVCVAALSAVFTYRYACALSRLIFRRLESTMFLQLFFRLIWSRTPGIIEDDDSPHGELHCSLCIAVCSISRFCSATFFRGTCTGAPSARSASGRSANLFFKKSTHRARRTP